MNQIDFAVSGDGGSLRAKRVEGWDENVKTHEDAKKYVQQMYPQFPEELAEAYAIVITNKASLDQKLGTSKLQKGQSEWDFMGEIKKAREEGAEAVSAKHAKELLDQLDLEEAKPKTRRKK